MSLSEQSTKQLMEIVAKSTTEDGRIAADYTCSYELKRVIDELAERAYQYEDLCE